MSDVYRARVIDVYDGDTITVSVSVWPDVYIDTRIRVRGIDTPERGHRAKSPREAALSGLATEHTRQWLPPDVLLMDVEHDKYAGRYLADVLHPDTGASLADALVAAGLAVAYTGRGEKQDWSKF